MKIQKILTLLLAVVFAFFGFASKAQAASSISITTIPPSGCQLSTTGITVDGSATADAPPGQLQQYAVDVNWGDGNSNTVLPQGSFGSGQGSNNQLFTGFHTYSTPGTYSIIATVYHQNINGQDNVSTDGNSFMVCIVSPLTITKTANTSYTRTWTWSIDKTASNTNLTLANGESYTVNYGVTANTSSVDSNWAVSGDISITNPSGNPTITVDVTDNLATDGTSPVACPTNSIAAGATLVCTYSKSLPGANNQLNTATIAASESVLNGTTTANVNFSNAAINKVDDCATVTDTNATGPQGVQVCSTDALPITWNYGLSFGKDAGAQVPLVCGVNTFTNTASFITNTTQAIGSKDVTVNATVACPLGCTLTQGYWKTHNASFKGGAPIDDTWDQLLISKENTGFYLSGKTWFGVFWTPPTGNAYYQLAGQFMAAKLNILNGAFAPANVITAIANATTQFNNYTPVQVGALKGNSSVRASFINLAGVLGSYNEGSTGPGHCSE